MKSRRKKRSKNLKKRNKKLVQMRLVGKRTSLKISVRAGSILMSRMTKKMIKKMKNRTVPVRVISLRLRKAKVTWRKLIRLFIAI